jgi:hypothetical protein
VCASRHIFTHTHTYTHTHTHPYLGFFKAFSICRVNDKDQGIVVLVVVPPQLPQAILTSHIPNREGNILIIDSFDIEAV